MNKRRKAFDEMFGCSIDISKDETGEYSHPTTRLCYSFFVVGLDQQQKRIDELEKHLDEIFDQKWEEWKTTADMHSQGFADGIEYAQQQIREILK